jgi:hypothetical protein
MTRPVRNKLFDLEFDEVSAVDRPANQLGLIAFAKSAQGEDPNSQEDSMPEIEVYDSDGLAVDGAALEHGDVVYDEDGTEYVYVEEDSDDESEDDEDGEQQAYYEDQDEDEDEEAYAGVGKAGLPGLRRAAFATSAKEAGRGARTQAYGFMHGLARNRSAASSAAPGAQASRFGSAAWGNRSNLQRAGIATAAATPFVAGGAVAGNKKFGKSLGDEVLENLSKAVNDDERSEIFAKALNEVEIYKAASEAMAAELDDLRDQQIEDVFIAKAAEYNLPVSPGVLGPILKAMTEVLDDEQLEVVDQLFASVGDALYDEIGYVGDTDNVSVLDQVNAFAGELVNKSDLSPEQAQVLAFESNPAAYEAYLNEIGR